MQVRGRSKAWLHGIQEQVRSRGGTDLPQDTNPRHYTDPQLASRAPPSLIFIVCNIYILRSRTPDLFSYQLALLLLDCLTIIMRVTFLFSLVSLVQKSVTMFILCDFSCLCDSSLPSWFIVLTYFETFSVSPILKMASPFSCITETLRWLSPLEPWHNKIILCPDDK